GQPAASTAQGLLAGSSAGGAGAGGFSAEHTKLPSSSSSTSSSSSVIGSASEEQPQQKISDSEIKDVISEINSMLNQILIVGELTDQYLNKFYMGQIGGEPFKDNNIETQRNKLDEKLSAIQEFQ